MSDDLIQIRLSRSQLRLLATLARNEGKKAQRNLDKSTFVPEEGKRHGDQSRVDKMTKLASTLDAYAQEGVA